ncbi:MAG TPA: deoxynucleoside kinase [Sediminispirochaeta sp.]|nr:deoxynucleoside kinase [Sediminispirochaeta sp.]
MDKKHLVVAGNIGAGKSTLVSMICDRFGWKAYYEPVAQNPYLEKFYRDMRRWSFHSQVFFMTHRVKSHHSLAGDPHSVVQDRSIYEDAEVFARNLYEGGLMDDDDYRSYRELYHLFTQLLPVPDLVIYLQASVHTLQRRIAQRGREFEADIAPDYLENLNRLYQQWIDGFDLAPVLSVPGDELDFVKNSEDLHRILDGVEARLRDSQKLLFPDGV